MRSLLALALLLVACGPVPAPDYRGQQTAALQYREPLPPARPRVTPAAGTWLPIHDGQCPATHPIKANPLSGIYHLPESGDSSYSRLRNDRVQCYAELLAAEAAGYRRARN